MHKKNKRTETLSFLKGEDWFSYGKFKFSEEEKECLKEKWDVSL